jgi:hypothetical protein
VNDNEPIFDSDGKRINRRIFIFLRLFDRDFVCPHPHLVRIKDRPSIGDIELPAVPGALDDFILSPVLDLEGSGRERCAHNPAATEGSSLMWTAVSQTEKFTVDVENADRVTLNVNDAPGARGKVRQPCNCVLHPDVPTVDFSDVLPLIQ